MPMKEILICIVKKILKREEELLNTSYFHLVFTIPHELNTIALSQAHILYKVLFKTAWQTMKGFGDNPTFLGAKTGMIALLHTWGQNLSLHPHLHCIVPAGGITQTGKWKKLKAEAKDSWTIEWDSLKFKLELTKFKHVGLFPEQKINWEFIKKGLKSNSRFINFFAYTGAMSCVARENGAETYHVDSVKQLITWAAENANLSNLNDSVKLSLHK